ncbi:hypothetical protein T459_16655 [Capsicum annuum]|uniref:Uncharacterized protein n=1 Tax=Capsicum annuum TaxID=4072 RepID=A0A2G2Z9C0_CAPAN|nr:hypothetical protein T459_16655 [Capsicum annuum]
MDILSNNPYSIFLRSLVNIYNLENFHISLRCDSSLDQRVYNLPSSSDITAIWVEKNDGNAIRPPHIQIYTRSNCTRLVNYYYGCYDALQYPLLFSYGQSGWHCGIEKVCEIENVCTHPKTFEIDEIPNI